MAKIAVHLDGGERLNETELGVLTAIADRQGPESDYAQLSVREVGERFGVSALTVRRTVHSLAEKGLLEIRACFDGNGGRLANAYRPTPRGLRVVAGEEGAVAPGFAALQAGGDEPQR